MTLIVVNVTVDGGSAGGVEVKIVVITLVKVRVIVEAGSGSEPTVVVTTLVVVTG